jgi:hypothetical protein
VARADDVAAVDRLFQHLLEHERVPLRAQVHQVAELRPDRLGVEDGRDHLRDLAPLERRQLDRLGHGRAAPRLEERREGVPPVELVAPVGDEDERAHAGEPAGEVVEQLARRRVGPVDVLDDEEQAALVRRDGEQRDDGLEEPELRLRRVAERGRRLVAAELREELGELEPRCAEQARDPLHVLAGEVVPERLDEREVRQRQLGLAARAPEHLPVEPPRARRELAREPRLPHPGLAAERDEAALAAVRREQRVLEGEELLLAADEGGAEGAFEHVSILPSG